MNQTRFVRDSTVSLPERALWLCLTEATSRPYKNAEQTFRIACHGRKSINYCPLRMMQKWRSYQEQPT